ncbi:MAG: hypothetical protein JWQ36_2858 [Enterovirga sp.]|jgi:hypothetical protein|nr:hypothetical protein [Enterovirga sp.]
MLEFHRQDCERLRRSVPAADEPVINRSHCFGYRMQDVRVRPASSGPDRGHARAGGGDSSGQ